MHADKDGTVNETKLSAAFRPSLTISSEERTRRVISHTLPKHGLVNRFRGGARSPAELSPVLRMPASGTVTRYASRFFPACSRTAGEQQNVTEQEREGCPNNNAVCNRKKTRNTSVFRSLREDGKNTKNKETKKQKICPLCLANKQESPLKGRSSFRPGFPLCSVFSATVAGAPSS